MLIRYINGVVYTKDIDLSRIINAIIQTPIIDVSEILTNKQIFFLKFKKKTKTNPQGCKFIIR